MLVVRTNVDYQVVALFVVRQETVENISAALEVIKGWNPVITPQFAMVDVSEVEIRALEEAFPGNWNV